MNRFGAAIKTHLGMSQLHVRLHLRLVGRISREDQKLIMLDCIQDALDVFKDYKKGKPAPFSLGWSDSVPVIAVGLFEYRTRAEVIEYEDR